MKKPLVVIALIAALVLAAVSIAVLVGARIVGPRLISVAAPSGVPLGEHDVPRPEPSRLALHLVVPLSLLDEVANAEVPPTFRGTGTKNFHKRIRNGTYSWEVARREIRFQNRGDQLAFAVPFEGQAHLKGELDAAILTLPFTGQAAVAGVASGTLKPEIGPNWQVIPNLVPDVKLDKASLQLGQLGSVEIGDFLGGNLGQYLQKEARKFAPALRKSLPLRREAQKLWNEAHLVEQVSDEPALWLKVSPSRFLLGPIDYATPGELSVAVAVDAETSLLNRAPAPPQRTPLPDLTPLEGAPRTDLRLPLILGMAELNAVLAKEEFDLDTGVGTTIKVHGLAAEVGQGGYLNLKLDLVADRSTLGRGVTGSIWVRGRPVIDYERQTLGFTQIELTVETEDRLSHAAKWLLGDLLVSALEAKLRVDLSDYQAELDEEVQKALAGGRLPEGVEISLRELEIRLLDVYTVSRHVPGGEDDPGLVLVVQATAEVSSRIHRLDFKKSDEP